MRIFKIFLVLALMGAALAWGVDAPVEFAQDVEGRLHLYGLSGYCSTPSRVPQSAFGVNYFSLGPLDVQSVGASAEIPLGPSPFPEISEGRFRLGIHSSLLWMDSLYRRVYSQVDFSAMLWHFVLGTGHGFSAEWIPGDNSWGRHRYKAGTSFFWKGVSLGIMGSGWYDDLSHSRFVYGLQVQGGQSFKAFGEWDGSYFDVGSSVQIKNLSVKTSYRFPGFGVSASVELQWSRWFAEGLYGFFNDSWEWFGLSVVKRVSKKTIL